MFYIDDQNILQKAIPDTEKYLTGPPTITPLQIVTSKVCAACLASLVFPCLFKLLLQQDEGFVGRGLRATVEAQPGKVTQLIAKFKVGIPFSDKVLR